MTHRWADVGVAIRGVCWGTGMDQGTTAVVAVSLLLVTWYVAGHIYNRRRGRRLRRWLETGLGVLGGEREAGWIGSPASGARINVRQAKSPFRRLVITLLLENREIPLLWLLDCLRGKRDRIIIRATLRSPRSGEVRLPSNGPSEREAGSWMWLNGPQELNLAYRGRNAQRMATALAPWVDTYGSQIRCFHWRKQDPHINLQLKIAGLLDTKAETFFADLSTALRPN